MESNFQMLHWVIGKIFVRLKTCLTGSLIITPCLTFVFVLVVILTCMHKISFFYPLG